MIHADWAHYLPQDILTKVDRATMSCGVEARSPFLDVELAEFAASLPLSWHLGPRGGKRMLRRALSDRAPDFVWQRRKQGFGVPLAHWFRAQWQHLLRERLSHPGLDHIEVGGARRLLDEHARSTADHSQALWNILSYVTWMQQRRMITG
jgi:asparagine synthase (glutamine-hydrolysing)